MRQETPSTPEVADVVRPRRPGDPATNLDVTNRVTAPATIPVWTEATGPRIQKGLNDAEFDTFELTAIGSGYNFAPRDSESGTA
jgi:hypothetical protein